MNSNYWKFTKVYNNRKHRIIALCGQHKAYIDYVTPNRKTRKVREELVSLCLNSNNNKLTEFQKNKNINRNNVHNLYPAVDLELVDLEVECINLVLKSRIDWRRNGDKDANFVRFQEDDIYDRRTYQPYQPYQLDGIILLWNILRELWEMEENTFTNCAQWIPCEVYNDIMEITICSAIVSTMWVPCDVRDYIMKLIISYCKSH